MESKNQQKQKLDNFFRSGVRLAYKRGETIIRADDTPAGIYYIESGYVKACCTTKYGEENLLMMRKDGEIFPFIWAFTGKHRNTSYETMTACTLWKVSRDEYLKFLNENPDILPILLDVVIEKYSLHSDRLNSLSYRTARERIVSFLIILSDRFSTSTKDGIRIDAPVKRQDIASSISATRETTSREMSLLTKNGLISEIDGHIVLINIEKLRKMV